MCDQAFWITENCLYGLLLFFHIPYNRVISFGNLAALTYAMNDSSLRSDPQSKAIQGFGRPKNMFAHRDPLAPYPRCQCGVCSWCKDNEKWDRIFMKFAVHEYGDVKGVFQSTLRDI